MGYDEWVQGNRYVHLSNYRISSRVIDIISGAERTGEHYSNEFLIEWKVSILIGWYVCKHGCERWQNCYSTVYLFASRWIGEIFVLVFRLKYTNTFWQGILIIIANWILPKQCPFQSSFTYFVLGNQGRRSSADHFLFSNEFSFK